MTKPISSLAKELTKEFWEKIIAFITAGLGFVAALFWQNAIRDAINAFIPTSGAWQYEIFVAVLVTFFAVLTIYLMTRFAVKQEQEAMPK